jgi:hypothetical protein
MVAPIADVMTVIDVCDRRPRAREDAGTYSFAALDVG